MEDKIKTEMLEKFIRENKLSKNQFCKMCKISHVTLQKIMTNKSNFRISAIFRIARAMQIEVWEMFD
ncbi:MAG: helix-turn-helix transcriptional regulator [Clostridia bacterium]|nr:helix-turn-helix transcriptional regulator [Clostridia bacterium]